MSRTEASQTLRVVYELREAAIAHGRALEAADLIPSPTTRDRARDTKVDLETRTLALIEACAHDEPAIA
ncbi:MAG: hypothetical protein NVS3B17_21960 [Vulcanimicrobiaceae bacterium]